MNRANAGEAASERELTSAELLEAVATLRREREQLRARLAFKDRLLARVHSAVIATESSGRITFLNEAAERMFGLRHEEALGSSAEDVVGFDVRPRLESVLATGDWEGEAICRAAGGREFDAEVRCTALRDRLGTMTGAVTSIRDISGRTRAARCERALTEISSARYSTYQFDDIMTRALIESVAAVSAETGVIALRDGNGWIIRHACGVPEGILGTRMRAEDAPNAAVALETKRPVAIEDALAAEHSGDEFLRARGVRSALVIPLVVREERLGVLSLHHRAPAAFDDVALDFAGRLHRVLGLALENARLVDELRAELDARTRISRLYAVLRRVNAMTSRCEDEASVFDALCRTLVEDGGYPLAWVGLVEGERIVPRAAFGPQAAYLDAITVTVAGELGQRPAGTAVRENRPVVNQDFTNNARVAPWSREAERHGFLSSAAFPLRRKGSTVGVMTVYAQEPNAFDAEQTDLVHALAADVSSALDALENEQRRAKAERALAEREAALHGVALRRSHFLAVLSHELRNPLTPIQSSLYVLARAASAEQAAKARATIERQVTRLTRLVDDLLDVTRLTSKKLRIDRVRFDLVEAVRRVAEDHRRALEGGQIRFTVEFPPSPILVDGDPTRIAQVIGNLLSNAAKFTPRDGRVVLAVEEGRDGALVRVRDTGVGIHPDFLPRLFEPFSQADESIERTRTGLGHGLSLVQGLVEMHGGQVAVRSDGVGKGAEFTVMLPKATGLLLPPNVPSSKRPPRRRVLLVDDVPDVAESLRDLLELEGHTVAIAPTGAEALALLGSFNPDVVFCDIGLPDMDGYAVAKACRADESHGETFLVVLSGYASEEDQRRAREAGFDEHIAKPPSYERIADVLRAIPRRPRR